MFILDGKEITIEPRMLNVPEFKRIWKRDKDPKKEKANKEFAYIYFMADYVSEYNAFGLDKEVMICREVMNNEEYRPDDSVIDAIQKYEKLQDSYSMRYLKSVRKTVDTLIVYYDNLRDDLADPDKPLKDPKKVLDAMKGVEDILVKVEKWEKKVSGEDEDMTIRGGGKAGLFEDPERASWLKKKVHATK